MKLVAYLSSFVFCRSTIHQLLTANRPSAFFLLPLALILLPAVFACESLTDGMLIDKSIQLCSDTYDVPNGVVIRGDNLRVDCGTAVLRGVSGESEIGVRLENAVNVTLERCNILTFNQGLYMKNVSFSTIRDNAFLKNRIGIRMLNSFENVIDDNSDKSHQLAVSAINSKYNVVKLGNKNVERDFCAVNSCNEVREMDVCEDGDFYCSPSCGASQDSDCGSSPSSREDELISDVVEFRQPETLVRMRNPAVGAAVASGKNQSVQQIPLDDEPREFVELPLPAKFMIYVVLYLVAFLGLLVWKR